MDTQPLDALPEATKEIPVEKASRGVGLSSGLIFFITVIIQLIGYFATYFFAQGIGLSTSGRELLGLMQFDLLLASSINGIGDLRIGSAYTFFVARGKSPLDQTATYLLLRFLLVGSAGILVWWTVGPQLQTSGGPFAPPGSEVYLTLAIFLTLPLLWSVSTVYTQLKIAQGESVRSQYPLLLESIVRTVVLIVVATHHPTIWTITFAYLPGAVLSTLYCIPAVRRYFARFSWRETVGMFTFAWPLMGGLILSYLAGNAMALLVFSQAHAQALYFYNAANGFRILALAVPTAVVVPLFPSLTSLHARGMLNSIRSQTWHALRFTAMAVAPAAVYLVVYRVPVLHILYNSSTASGGQGALAMLAISAIPYALTMIIGTVLNSIRLQRLELYLTTVQVIVLFGTAALLLPPLSLAAGLGVNPLLGATIAVLASAIAALGVNTYFLERHLGLRIPVRPILSITFSAAIGFFAVSRFNILVDVSRWYDLLPGIVIGFTVYTLVLAGLGELSQADVRQLCGMVRLPASVSNILARLCWRKENPYAPDVAPPVRGPPA